MVISKVEINGLYVVDINRYSDNRGYFERLFCDDHLKRFGLDKKIVQVNHSYTRKKGSVRGLHYQVPPYAEMKFVKCIKGSVFDVAIDLRNNSPHFLKWHSEILTENNNKMLIIPEGFAHGFQTLEDDTELLYFHTEFFNFEAERSIRFDDKNLNITWPLEITDLSEKDKCIPDLDKTFKGIEL